MEVDGNSLPAAAAGKKPVSLAKSKAGGALIALLGLGMAYFFMLKPLQEANRTGRLEYSMKAVLLAPAFVYAGLAVMLFDMRDGQISVVGTDGKKRLTTKGKWFIAGLVVVMAASAGGWEWYLHAIGFTSGT